MSRLLRSAARLLQQQQHASAGCSSSAGRSSVLVSACESSVTSTSACSSSSSAIHQASGSCVGQRGDLARCSRCFAVAVPAIVVSISQSRAPTPQTQAGFSSIWQCAGRLAHLHHRQYTSLTTSRGLSLRHAAIVSSSSSGSSGGASSGLSRGWRIPTATAAAATSTPMHQLQQLRGLLGKPSTKPKKVNYQDHNQKKPKKIKMKTRRWGGGAFCRLIIACV